MVIRLNKMVTTCSTEIWGTLIFYFGALCLKFELLIKTDYQCQFSIFFGFYQLWQFIWVFASCQLSLLIKKNLSMQSL